ncbi:MAG TPA: sigma-70 family RNA polymerase sigma factor, partial [Bryobacteraceae bacterium]|nr:sigma-70 family RNA polymerase sigma factor [Bryobacteraceae bacterium]
EAEVLENLPNGTLPFDFDSVFHAQYERVARAIMRIVRDRARAEELAVEVFWKLWRHPQAQGANVNGWLHRTAIRSALDEIRKQGRREKYERFLPWIRPAQSPEDLHATSSEQQRVRKVLAGLPRRDSELLLLRGDGLSYREMAAALDLNPASLGTLLSRAQESFRKEYIKRYGEQ